MVGHEGPHLPSPRLLTPFLPTPSSMRASLRLLKPTVAVPVSSIPSPLLRLPPKATTAPKASNTSSPTIDSLMKTMRRRRVSAPTGLVSGDGRGLSNSIGAMAGAEADEVVDKVEEMVSAGKELPPNLRIEEFVAKRLEYAGVKSSHRDLVRPRTHYPFFLPARRSRADAMGLQLRKLRREG